MHERFGFAARRDEDGKVRREWTGLEPGAYQLSVLCPDAHGFHLGRGVVDVLTTGSVDVRVWAPGYQLATAPAVNEDRTIALQRARVANIAGDVPSQLPADVELVLRLVPRLDFPDNAQVTLDTGRGMPLKILFMRAQAAALTAPRPPAFAAQASTTSVLC